MRPGACAAAVALAALVLAGDGPRADWRTPPRGEGPDQAPVRRIDDQPYLAVNDLGRLIDATKFWRADLRRLVLRRGPHSIVIAADNPFVVVDDRTLYLRLPVRTVGGELHVPVALIDSLPSDSTLVRLFHDRRQSRVVVLPPSGGLGSPRLVVGGESTRMIFPADRPDEAVVVTRDRAHFRLRFGGYFTGALPDSLPPGSLVRRARPIAVAGGTAFELEIDPAAAAFRLVVDTGARRLTLELLRQGVRGAEAFAPGAPPGPRRLSVIVIDPGHGGDDNGVVVDGTAEKDLTLALAKLVRADLERTLRVRVVLTRGDDRPLPPEARAEVANRVRADLVLALHFDGFESPAARGATGYCAPATYAPGGRALGDAEAGDSPGPSPVVLLPWRDVGARHAAESRALTEAVLSALELRGLGPTRLRERLPVDLLGVNAPGLLLECATLTSPADLDRVTQREGLREIAASIAAGVAAYQANQ